MMIFNKKSGFFIVWAIVFILTILVRVPHFLSDGFFIDEDEAIVGLMSLDYLSGELFPYYFYGQHYGLCFFEVNASALMILIFGKSVWSLKLAALLLFSLGITFVAKTFSMKAKPAAGIIAVVVLLSIFPTWYIWGAMLRGGYVTGFAACCAIFYLANKDVRKVTDALWLGLLVFVVFESHTLFLLPILPLVFFWWLKGTKKITRAILFILSAAGLVILVKKIYPVLTGESTSSFSMVGMRWENLVTHLEGWMNGFSGYYFFGVNFAIPLVWKIGIVLMVVLTLLAILYGLINLDIKLKLTIALMLLGIVALLPLISLMDDYTPRYLISVFTGLLFSFLLVALYVNSNHMYKVVQGLSLIALVGVVFTSTVPRHWYNNGQHLLSDIQKLKERVDREKVKGVIALDSQFLWNYLYGDEIPAANLCWHNRTSAYSLQVKELFDHNPDDILLFGFHGIAYGIELQEDFESEQISDNFFLMREVRMNDLEKGRQVYPCYYTPK